MLLSIIIIGFWIIPFESINGQDSTVTMKANDPKKEIIYPAKEWVSKPPENFGFSTKKLAEVKSYFEKIGGDAFVVIKNGFIIASWGELSKPIPNFSIRKSYLNSLLGIEYGNGNLHLATTLHDLNIDDKSGLTNSEKQARIKDIITSSSGVFHDAAHESKEQAGARPPRGSFKPGTFFYYNNWDFNVLGHIYSQLSKEKIFQSFKERIADKIEMEDFDLKNTAYEYESTSNYPAYIIESSARDDARFGYLYLRNGKWNGEQIIPEEWIRMSFTTQVETGKHWYYDYGFLWWIDSKNEQYFARGNSGQFIAVLPKEDMVIVFRADPGSILNKWFGLRVKPQESFLLVPKILNSRIEK